MFSEDAVGLVEEMGFQPVLNFPRLVDVEQRYRQGGHSRRLVLQREAPPTENYYRINDDNLPSKGTWSVSFEILVLL